MRILVGGIGIMIVSIIIILANPTNEKADKDYYKYTGFNTTTEEFSVINALKYE